MSLFCYNLVRIHFRDAATEPVVVVKSSLLWVGVGLVFGCILGWVWVGSQKARALRSIVGQDSVFFVFSFCHNPGYIFDKPQQLNTILYNSSGMGSSHIIVVVTFTPWIGLGCVLGCRLGAWFFLVWLVGLSGLFFVTFFPEWMMSLYSCCCLHCVVRNIFPRCSLVLVNIKSKRTRSCDPRPFHEQNWMLLLS